MPPEVLDQSEISELIDEGVENIYQLLKLPPNGPVLIITDAESGGDCIINRVVATRFRDTIKPFSPIDPLTLLTEGESPEEVFIGRNLKIWEERERPVQVIGFSISDESSMTESKTLEALKALDKQNPTQIPLTVVYLGKQWEGEAGIVEAVLQHSTVTTVRLFSVEDLDLQKIKETSKYLHDLTI